MGIISQFITAWVGCFWDFTSQNMTMTWGELWVQAKVCECVETGAHESHEVFTPSVLIWSTMTLKKKGRYQKDHEEIGSVILIRIQMGPASALFFDTLSGGPYSKVFVIQFDPPTTNPHYPCALQIESFLHAIPLSRTTGCSLTQDHGLSGSSLMNS